MLKISMKDIPVDGRPQERLYKYGVESLTDEELIALILRSGTKKENVLNLSKRILSVFNGINGILDASIDELINIDGIKKVKAAETMAVAEICRRYNGMKVDKVKITCPKDGADYVMNDMMHLKQETLKVLLLNKKNVIIGERDVFKGSLDSSIASPREIFSVAVKNSASSIIVCHNHPSGNPEPSSEDINITKRLKECGTIIGIELLDHLIIGYNKYVSMKEKGII